MRLLKSSKFWNASFHQSTGFDATRYCAGKVRSFKKSSERDGFSHFVDDLEVHDFARILTEQNASGLKFEKITDMQGNVNSEEFTIDATKYKRFQ